MNQHHIQRARLKFWADSKGWMFCTHKEHGPNKKVHTSSFGSENDLHSTGIEYLLKDYEDDFTQTVKKIESKIENSSLTDQEKFYLRKYSILSILRNPEIWVQPQKDYIANLSEKYKKLYGTNTGLDHAIVETIVVHETVKGKPHIQINKRDKSFWKAINNLFESPNYNMRIFTVSEYLHINDLGYSIYSRNGIKNLANQIVLLPLTPHLMSTIYYKWHDEFEDLIGDAKQMNDLCALQANLRFVTGPFIKKATSYVQT